MLRNAGTFYHHHLENDKFPSLVIYCPLPRFNGTKGTYFQINMPLPICSSVAFEFQNLSIPWWTLLSQNQNSSIKFLVVKNTVKYITLKKITSHGHSLFITVILSLGKVEQMLFVSSFVFHQHNRYKGIDLIFFSSFQICSRQLGDTFVLVRMILTMGRQELCCQACLIYSHETESYPFKIKYTQSLLKNGNRRWNSTQLLLLSKNSFQTSCWLPH